LIYLKTEHFRRVERGDDPSAQGEAAGKHFHVLLDCGATVQAELVVLGAGMIYLDGIREGRPLLGCKVDCKKCVLGDTEALRYEDS